MQDDARTHGGGRDGGGDGHGDGQNGGWSVGYYVKFITYNDTEDNVFSLLR